MFVLLAWMAVSTVVALIPIATHFLGFCVWPFNLVQLGLGQNGMCNMNVNIKLLSLLVDQIFLVRLPVRDLFSCRQPVEATKVDVRIICDNLPSGN